MVHGRSVRLGRPHRVLCVPVIVGALLVGAAPSAAEEHELAAESSTVDNPHDYMPPGKRYARVTERTPVFESRDDILDDRVSDRHGSADAEVWVVVHDRTEVDGEPYYLAGWDWNTSAWIPGDSLSFSLTLSPLRGVDLTDRSGRRPALVHVDSAPVHDAPPAEAGDEIHHTSSRLGALTRYDLVTVKEEVTTAAGSWYRIGSDQWIVSEDVRELTPGDRPESIDADERWIEVNLRKQTLFAHEGDTPLFATLVSTGREGRETITGLFRPWIVLRSAPMRGRSFGLDYDLAHVPWVVYFEGSFAWHGTYWHDRFGTRMSAGCINLSPHDAKWLIEWAEPSLDGAAVARPDERQPGTWVYIRG